MQTQTTVDEWWMSHSNLCQLFRWLVENERVDLEDAIRFIEKPWHFDMEWREMQSERGH